MKWDEKMVLRYARELKSPFEKSVEKQKPRLADVNNALRGNGAGKPPQAR